MGKTYEDGLNEAWEVVRRLENELAPNERVELFGYYSPYDIVNTITPQEVIEKLEKHDRIEVGDEVKGHSTVGIVLERCYNDEMTIMWANGSVTIGHKKRDLTKTGRHFPQIAEILRQIQEGK